MNYHPLFGEKRRLLSDSRFPTKLQVLNYVRFAIDSSPKKQQLHAEKIEKYQEIASELIRIWEEVYVKCLCLNYVSQKIENEIVPTIQYVQKNCKKIQTNEKKKSELFSELDKVFDIAKCRCFVDKLKEQFIPSNCNCPQQDKIINLETYSEQLFDREAKVLLSEAQKSKFELLLSAIKLSPGKFRSKSFNCIIMVP